MREGRQRRSRLVLLLSCLLVNVSFSFFSFFLLRIFPLDVRDVRWMVMILFLFDVIISPFIYSIFMARHMDQGKQHGQWFRGATYGGALLAALRSWLFVYSGK
ncbi:hypothetical protein MPH_12295 [Macrophomina phaseolina MS6]|uniref:Uncharacterized protein n=1 Tax=Macrophomina phaseolina (strain MS6) TaxID=1126212 RepID=K2RKH6_MACPH|nr:hypothetical protein MPH_12295 [Macrophomina phaseolina MS6]